MRRSLVAAVLVALVAGGCSNGGKDDATPERIAGAAGFGLPAAPVVTKDVLNKIRKEIEFDPVERAGSDERGPRWTYTREASSVAEFLQIAYREVDDFWRRGFVASGGGDSYTSPKLVAVSEGSSLTTACVRGGSGEGAQVIVEGDSQSMTCPFGGEDDSGRVSEDPILYLPVGWAVSFKDVNPEDYDFALASAVAHVFGHHIQAIVLSLGGVSKDNVYALPGKYGELSADCLSGIWAADAYSQGELEGNDLLEGIGAAWKQGSDPSVAGGASGDFATSEERVKAWQYGLNSGNPIECFGEGSEDDAGTTGETGGIPTDDQSQSTATGFCAQGTPMSEWTIGAKGVALSAAQSGGEEILPGGPTALHAPLGEQAGYQSFEEAFRFIDQYGQVSKLSPNMPGKLTRWIVLGYAGRFYAYQGQVYESTFRDDEEIKKNPDPPPCILPEREVTVAAFKGFRYTGSSGQERWIGYRWTSGAGGEFFEANG